MGLLCRCARRARRRTSCLGSAVSLTIGDSVSPGIGSSINSFRFYSNIVEDFSSNVDCEIGLSFGPVVRLVVRPGTGSGVNDCGVGFKVGKRCCHWCWRQSCIEFWFVCSLCSQQLRS